MSATPPPPDDEDDDASLAMPLPEPVPDPLDSQGPLKLPDPVPGIKPVRLSDRDRPGSGGSAGSSSSSRPGDPSRATGSTTAADPTDPADPADGSSSRRRARRTVDRSVLNAVAGCALVGASGAALSSAHPTGTGGFDPFLCFAFAAAVVLAASVARRWTWLVLSGAAVVLAGPAPVRLLAVVALGVALYGAGLARKRNRIAGAAVGALSMQALLRTGHIGFHGCTALLVGVVTLLVLVSGWRASRRTTRKKLRPVIALVAVVLVLAVAGVGFAMLQARTSLQNAVSESRAGLDAALDGKQAIAAQQWALADKSFTAARQDLDKPWAKGATLVPIVAQHARAVREVTGSGVDISHTATIAALTAPYRDLRSRDGQVNLTLLRKMQQPVADTASALTHAEAAVTSIDSSWLLPVLAHPLADYHHQLDRALPEASRASRALDVAPGLLGGSGTRHYLVLFSTPSESRFLGGFIGSWAELTATNGKLKITRHGRSGELDDNLAALPGGRGTLTGVDEFVSRYGRYSPQSFFQNVTASPDFPTVDQVASQLYPQAGGDHVDGTMYVDPIGLAALLQLSGPVQVEGLGYPLTSANAAQFLLNGQYTQFRDTTDRTDFLSQASTATFDALTTRTLPTIPHITDALDPVVRQHRLMFTSHQPDENSFLGELGMVGAFPRAKGADLLSVRTSNGNPSKIDYYLHRTVHDLVAFDPRNGFVDSTITVKLRNDAPVGGGGLPDYVVGNDDITAGKLNGQPIASNNMLVSVYSTLDRPTATINGKPAPIEVEREFGYNVYTFPVLVPAGTTGVLVLHVSGKVAPSADYRLVLPVQPLVNQDTVSVAVRSDTDKAKVDAKGTKVQGGVARVTVPATENHTVAIRFDRG